MKTIAFFNVKGGVGKTTSAVNIAYLAAQSGTRTILWDLDPQSCATWNLGIDDDSEHKAIRVFKGKTPLGKLRLHSPYRGLDVIPADLSLRKLEHLLGTADEAQKLLDKLADHLSEQNKLLVFDCAPAYSKLSENIFSCCDVLVVPLLPSPLSLRSYEQLKSFLSGKKQWKKLRLQPFFTMVDRRRKIHTDVLEQAKELIDEETPLIIPYASDYEKMGTHRAPIHCFAAATPAAQAYQMLWNSLQDRYQLH